MRSIRNVILVVISHVYVSHLLRAAAWQNFSSVVLQALDDVSVPLISRPQLNDWSRIPPVQLPVHRLITPQSTHNGKKRGPDTHLHVIQSGGGLKGESERR